MHTKAARTCWSLAILVLIAIIPVVGVADSRGPISEETPPAACDTGSFVSEVKCIGKYCDNIAISCARFRNVNLGRTAWTSWVSEEQGGSRSCPNNYLVAGVACRGKYCDNLSLYCVEVTNATQFSCSTTSSVSEEHGGRLGFFRGDKAGQLFAATGVQCSGKYCDNKAFNVCEIGLE